MWEGERERERKKKICKWLQNVLVWRQTPKLRIVMFVCHYDMSEVMCQVVQGNRIPARVRRGVFINGEALYKFTKCH